ncbi:uncharacterized protein LAESUDRAFT_724096, partial [Laetiporus sulphureus 93-53]
MQPCPRIFRRQDQGRQQRYRKLIVGFPSLLRQLLRNRHAGLARELLPSRSRPTAEMPWLGGGSSSVAVLDNTLDVCLAESSRMMDKSHPLARLQSV